ncbi:hypothetical protein ACFP3Q_17960 [Nocardioides sp. GCM10027113]|uniref:hypothetical protein n=1 Tax=unclassified Nocardioides TaxID=2615069 RepID=UPI0036104AD4
MGETPPGPGPLDDDPFWAVIHRRHPDVDVVLLPDDAAPTAPDNEPAVDLTDADIARLDSRVLAIWCELADLEAAGPESRWLAGPTPDDVRREATLTAEAVEPLEGTTLLEEAVAQLRARGWHVSAPPDGTPRVLAARLPDEGGPAAVGREELHLLLAPGTGRLVLRHRSAGIRVGREQVHALVTGGRP